VTRHTGTGARSVAAVHQLWDELSDFQVAQTDAALMHLMRTLIDWLDADDAMWLAAVRTVSGRAARSDALNGWRVRAVRRFSSTPVVLEAVRKGIREQDSTPGMASRALSISAGKFRVHRLRDGFVDLKAFQDTQHFDAFYRRRRIDDRMWCVFPVNRDAESYLAFDHVGSKRRFRASDTELVERALRGIKWFHRKLLLSHNLLVADAPISSSQRRVLLHLLTDRTEKEIAAQLGHTPGTIHQYATDLYRAFGVRGRAGLMQLWLHG
jgi:DNA-binding CsgD family transcriptional regulator